MATDSKKPNWSKPAQLPEQDSKSDELLTVEDVAAKLGVSKNKVWELSKRSDDSLPLRRLLGQRKGSIAFRDELLEWAKRNFTQIGVG